MKFNSILVIPNLLLASAYPGEKDLHAHRIITRKIVDAGIEVVVNIMEIKELERFTPYEDLMSQYAKEGSIFKFKELIF